MKKINIFVKCLLALVMVAVTSCSDAPDEITSYLLNRNFSPVDFDVNSVSTTAARLQWTPVDRADKYVVELFADDSLTFAGSPAKVVETESSSIEVTGLVYDTKYSARVQAITTSDPSRTSKYSEVFFRTSAQQFMNSFKEENIADRSVTASWDVEAVGAEVTALRALDAKGKIVSTKELTAEEKAAGRATIGGLSPETVYTIKLLNGEKERGSRTVTTIADLAGAILLHAGDDIANIIKDAEPNAVLALYGGVYEIPAEDEGKMGAAKIEKNITIKGIYPTNKPIIKGRYEIYEGAALSISQVILDGADNATGDQTFNYKTADVDYGALNLQDVTIKNFVKGICYGNVTATIESITFNNCIIDNIECDGGDFFDLRKSYAKKVTFSNSTISNSAQNRDLIRYDDSSGSYTDAAPIITVDKCTIYNVLNETKAKRLLYVRFVGNQISWTNNLLVQTQAVYTNQSKTDPDGITYDNNYYFNCTNSNLFDPSDSAGETKVYWNGDTNGKNGSDPQFKNASAGDFTIGNGDVKKLKVGDPRWY